MRTKPIDITGGVPSEEHVRRLRGELPEDEWQRPADALPDDGQHVLVWLRVSDTGLKEHMAIAQFFAPVLFRHEWKGHVLFWRPLPEPPTEPPPQA